MVLLLSLKKWSGSKIHTNMNGFPYAKIHETKLTCNFPYPISVTDKNNTPQFTNIQLFRLTGWCIQHLLGYQTVVNG